MTDNELKIYIENRTRQFALYFPNMAEKYRVIFDKQENMINRYKIDIRI